MITYFVLSRCHGLIDLLELAIMRAEEFEGLGHWGHGSGWWTDLSAELLQRRTVQCSVLLLKNMHAFSMSFTCISHTDGQIWMKMAQILTLNLSTIISKSSCNCLSSSDYRTVKTECSNILFCLHLKTPVTKIVDSIWHSLDTSVSQQSNKSRVITN